MSLCNTTKRTKNIRGSCWWLNTRNTKEVQRTLFVAGGMSHAALSTKALTCACVRGETRIRLQEVRLEPNCMAGDSCIRQWWRDFDSNVIGDRHRERARLKNKKIKSIAVRSGAKTRLCCNPPSVVFNPPSTSSAVVGWGAIPTIPDKCCGTNAT